MNLQPTRRRVSRSALTFAFARAQAVVTILILSVLVLIALPGAAFAQTGPALTQSAPALDLPGASHITQILLAPTSPNLPRIGEPITVECSYSTPVPGGVYIVAIPMTRGAMTYHASYTGTDLLPSGSGRPTMSFTIDDGDQTVDHIRLEMFASDGTTLLTEKSIPVNYQFTSWTRNMVSQVELPATPNVFGFGQRVAVAFAYTATRPGGVRIFVRPVSNRAMTPNYVAHVSPVYPVGSGTGHGWFTITSGDTTVTHVRVKVWNAAMTKLIYKKKIPVSYQFRGAANIVRRVVLNPASANILEAGIDQFIDYRYVTNEPGGVRIFARPLTGGLPTTDFVAHPSPVYPIGNRTASGWFTINSEAIVDEVHIQMWNADETTLLFEVKLPVEYQFE